MPINLTAKFKYFLLKIYTSMHEDLSKSIHNAKNPSKLSLLSNLWLSFHARSIEQQHYSSVTIHKEKLDYLQFKTSHNHTPLDLDSCQMEQLDKHRHRIINTQHPSSTSL